MVKLTKIFQKKNDLDHLTRSHVGAKHDRFLPHNLHEWPGPNWRLPTCLPGQVLKVAKPVDFFGADLHQKSSFKDLSVTLAFTFGIRTLESWKKASFRKHESTFSLSCSTRMAKRSFPFFSGHSGVVPNQKVTGKDNLEVLDAGRINRSNFSRICQFWS